jgi:hypothetical protein
LQIFIRYMVQMYIALPYQDTAQDWVWFCSIDFSLGFRKNICTSVVPATDFAVLDCYKSKFCFVILELFFRLNNTVGRGLGIACNTLRMLVWIDFSDIEMKLLKYDCLQ